MVDGRNPRRLSPTPALGPTLALSFLALLASQTPATRANNLATDVIALKEGADLDLSCPIVVENEDLIISWTCNNEPANIRSSRIHVTDSGMLRIRSAKLGDSCNYRCEAADGYGTLSMIVKVIIVDTKLVKKLAQPNQTLPEKLAAQQQLQRILPHEAPVVSNPLGPNDVVGFMRRGSDIPLDQRQLNNDRKFNGPQPLVEPQPRQAEQQVESGLEIEIVPSSVHVKTNHTFSLECKVKHSTQAAPQIIWLKEFIGRQPDSLSEAHEQNLVVIDNVYYHSLNWPRSMTNWSNTANSALLVRQSNSVHSGRYICFAGYAPTIMSSKSLSFNPQAAGNHHQKRSLRYKLATAHVLVEKQEPTGGYRFAPRNLLIADSWPATLLVVCLTLCALLSLVGLHYFRHRKHRNGSSRRKVEARSGRAAYTAPDGKMITQGSSSAVKQLHDLDQRDQIYSDNNQVYYLHPKGHLSLADTHHVRTEDVECSQALNSNFTGNLSGEESSSRSDDNHLYSVIEDHDNLARASSDHYKVPNTVKP